MKFKICEKDLPVYHSLKWTNGAVYHSCHFGQWVLESWKLHTSQKWPLHCDYWNHDNYDCNYLNWITSGKNLISMFFYQWKCWSACASLQYDRNHNALHMETKGSKEASFGRSSWSEPSLAAHVIKQHFPRRASYIIRKKTWALLSIIYLGIVFVLKF